MLKRIGCLILVWILVSPMSVFAETGGPKIGQTAPNLIGRTMADDKPYRLKADKGSPKVINFFWVQCVPCRKEMPELAGLEKQYSGVKFISVHTQQEKLEVVSKFLKSLAGHPSNIVLTSGGVDQTFDFIGLPHTVVLDANNVVLANFNGYTKQNMIGLKNKLQELIR